MFATQVFARFAHEASQREVPPEALHHAQRAVIDWYASLLPGLAMPAVRVLEATMAEDLDRGDARLALGRAATPRAAARINGTAAHAAEVDDSFRDAMVHPGATTIAAGSAAAQATKATGVDFLRAVVLGYEVSTRIGVLMGSSHYKFWHNTGTMGSFGAAAAAASLLRPTRMRSRRPWRWPPRSPPGCSRPSAPRAWPKPARGPRSRGRSLGSPTGGTRHAQFTRRTGTASPAWVMR